MDTFQPLPSDSARPSSLPAAEPLLSIASVERETGLGKDTLRVWERRYGFPLPERDASGVRGYSPSLVERLRLIRRAVLAGHRPGRLLALPTAELDAVLQSLSSATSDRPADAGRAAAGPAPADAAPAGGHGMHVDECLAALRSGGAEALRHWLTRGLARMGLATFVIEGIAPLTAAIGNAWLNGSLAVYEEHLYSEAVQTVLRNGLLPFQAGIEMSAPRILLTTVPGEAHGLGLLMAEAVMTLEGCRCLSLGVQTPVADIVEACRAHRIDVVALSFSESLGASHVLAGLADLRARLPSGVRVWAGGGAAALRDLRIPGVDVLTRLVDIQPAVGAWRDERVEDTD